MADLVGTILGNRYAIEARLGDGSMGAVYRARHVRMGRRFAVKVLHPHLVANPKLMKRFHREAELAGKLDHENLISVVDVGESEGLCYLVMDLVDGPCMVDVIAEAPLDPERVIRLVRQLCDGLQRAHDLGLIHRDFKPENVIVQRDDRGNEVPKIVDFGIAILREQASSSSDDRLTTAGLVLGTPHYMAPEQAIGGAMDHRVDLFALGVICYEMLTGRMPFDGSGVDVARANLATPTPPMGVRVPTVQVDPLLEAFTAKLLAKARDKRPASAREARELLDLIERDRHAAAATLGVTLPTMTAPVPALRTTMAGPALRRPTRAQPASQPPPLRSSSRRGLAIAAAVATVVFVGVVAVAMLGRAEPAAASSGELSPPARTPAHRDAPGAPSPSSKASVAPATPPTRSMPPATSPDASTSARPAIAATPGRGAARASTSRNHDAAASNVVPANAPSRASSAHDRMPASAAPATRDTVPAPAPLPPSAKAVADLYVATGAALKRYSDAHGLDAAADLWSRYRRILLNDVLATPARREAVTELLQQIRRDLATR